MIKYCFVLLALCPLFMACSDDGYGGDEHLETVDVSFIAEAFTRIPSENKEKFEPYVFYYDDTADSIYHYDQDFGINTLDGQFNVHIKYWANYGRPYHVTGSNFNAFANDTDRTSYTRAIVNDIYSNMTIRSFIVTEGEDTITTNTSDALAYVQSHDFATNDDSQLDIKVTEGFLLISISQNEDFVYFDMTEF